MPLVRLDKFLSDALVLSRKDVCSAIRSGRVFVDGKCEKKADRKVDACQNEVTFDGAKVRYKTYIYIMMNKPAGFVCANDDKREKTVMSLFPKEYIDKGIACVGRLDKDTVGLLLLTNDGVLSHCLLSPKKHAEKTYLVTADKPFVPEDVCVMEKGIVIDGKNTAPAVLELMPVPSDPFTARVTLTEGKFHEVKRLCYACGQKEVTRLVRTHFAGLPLDSTLNEGQWRPLNDEEIKHLNNYKN